MANSLDGGGGFGSSNSFDQSFGSQSLLPPQPALNSKGLPDTNTVPGLLTLAQQQGGAVAEQASALANPTTSFLSTISNGFKNAFGGFIKAISLPSNIIAGGIDEFKGTGSITDAIKNGEDPYTAIFGKNIDPNETTMSKVGQFFVRTGTDILLDPLTYVTFGAGEGLLGLRATSEIPLFGDAAKAMDVEQGAKVALSGEGQDIYKATKGAENFYKANLLTLGHEQALGTAMGKYFATGDEAFNAAGDELKDLLNASLDMPASSAAAKDFTKKALSNMFSHAPQMVEDYIDHGGLKVFGQTIIEGARIRNAVMMIPGMTTIDHVTAPVRNMVRSLFDPSLIKVGGQYVRLPEEFMDMKNLAMSELTGKQNSVYQSMFDLAKAHGLNKDQVDLVTAALDMKKMPADPQLAKAYLDAMGLSPAEYQKLQAAGIPVSQLDGHVIPHVSLKDEVNVRSIPFKTPASVNTGASKNASLVKFIEQGKNDVEEQLPKEMKALQGVQGGNELMGKIRSAGSVQEAGFAVGEHLNNTVNDLTKDGSMSFEQAMQHPDVKTLMDTRNAMDAIPASHQLVGSAEGLGMRETLKADEVKSINDRLEESLTKHDVKMSDLEGQITKISRTMNDVATAKTTKQVKAIAESLGIKDASALKSIADQVGGQFGNLDVGRMVSSRLNNESIYSEGMKIPKELEEMEPSTVKEISAIGKELPAEQRSALEKAISDYKPKIRKPSMNAQGDDSGLASEFVKKFFEMNPGTEAKLSDESVASFVKTMKTAMEGNPKGFNSMLDQIIGRKQQIGDVLGDIRLDTQSAQEDLKALPNLDKFYTDTSGKNYKRMAAGLDELKQAGFSNFDTNFYTAHLSRMLDNSKAITMQSFVSDVAREFGQAADVAPKGYVSIESKAVDDATKKIFGGMVSKDGQQIVFHPAIAKYLEDFSGKVINDAPTSDMLKAFDKIQNAWKASVTSIFPAFHGRNALTHLINNALDLGAQVLNPTTHYMAAQFVRDDMTISSLVQKSLGIGEDALEAKNQVAEKLGKVMFTDTTGKDWTFGEIRQMVKDNGVAFGHTGAGGPEDIKLTQGELAAKMAGAKGSVISKVNPFSQDFLPFQVGRETGTALANQARMVNFISNLKNTGDVELAAARTKQFLFDYGNLTNFEKTFARRLIPFYTFTRKNLELQVQSLLTTPGRISAEVHSLQNLGDVITGNNKLSDAEQAALPDWIKAGLYSVTSKNGEDVSVQSGFASPIEQPFAALQPNAILGSLAPLIRVPIEQATGYSFFQGKPLSQITNATAFQHAPGFIQNLIGFTTAQGVDSEGKPFTYYVSLRPQMMNLLLNLPPTSRVFSSLKQIETADPSTQAGIMQQLIGTHPYDFNLTVEAQRQEDQLKQQLQDLLSSAHVTAKFSRSFVPKAQSSL